MGGDGWGKGEVRSIIRFSGTGVCTGVLINAPI